MKYTEIINEPFIEKLLVNISKIGITKYNIKCILLEGSAIYLDSFNDLDFKVIVKYYAPKAETLFNFEIDGYKVECCYYTSTDWKKVNQNRKDAQYIVEAPDMIKIYGNDDDFYRHDIVTDKNLQKYILDVYDKHLFNYNKKNKDTYLFKDKRLWNFLLFAFKIQNNSNELTKEQLNILQKAHDLELDKEDYRPLFNQIKESVING